MLGRSYETEEDTGRWKRYWVGAGGTRSRRGLGREVQVVAGRATCGVRGGVEDGSRNQQFGRSIIVLPVGMGVDFIDKCAIQQGAGGF